MACQDMIIFSMKTKLTEKAVPKRDESTKRTMPKRLLSEFEKKSLVHVFTVPADSVWDMLEQVVYSVLHSNFALVFSLNRPVARLWLTKQGPSIGGTINQLHNMKIQTNLRIGCTCALRPYMCCTQRFAFIRRVLLRCPVTIRNLGRHRRGRDSSKEQISW